MNLNVIISHYLRKYDKKAARKKSYAVTRDTNTHRYFIWIICANIGPLAFISMQQKQLEVDMSL